MCTSDDARTKGVTIARNAMIFIMLLRVRTWPTLNSERLNLHVAMVGRHLPDQFSSHLW